jgi:hypothetical protein
MSRVHCLARAFALLLIAAPASAALQKKPSGKVAPPSKPVAPSPEMARRDQENARARRAFDALSPGERDEVAEFFSAETERLGTFQLSLMRSVLKGQDKDSGLWPEFEPPPVFDPSVHAPGQVIPRQSLTADDPRVLALRNREPGPGFDVVWTYDYATRELRHATNVKDAARIFANGLAGIPPGLDLCTALVERALDDGSQQKVLTAFGHAYTDRSGTVYTGITLYDAWASGAEIEMPDVDTLGIVHTVLDDWKTWVAPVSPAQHDDLYGKLGELFKAAHRHRGLRHALAQTYLVGSATLRDGYAPHLDGFHALWEKHRSTPAELVPTLPAATKWEKFLTDWSKRYRSDSKLARGGQTRRATLDSDAAAVRATLLGVLTEFGAYERIDGGKSPPKR